MLRVTFPDNTSLSCEFGVKIESVAGYFGEQKAGSELVAVRVNNEILPLSAPLEVNARLEPVTRDSVEGTVIYRRSLAFLLALSARAFFSDERLSIGHSLGRSYYYT
ncbi:MAG: nucleoside kinase, partial [Treponema sp.]|nr:nucleoside kinase [Treponema sp.]